MSVTSYGIRDRIEATTAVEIAVESLSTLGYAVVASGFSDTELDAFSGAFETAHAAYADEAGGLEALRDLDEHNTIRAAFHYDRRLLELALHPTVREIVRRCIGGYQTLSQQNGIINPPNAERYNQGAWHRDLPYQHSVFSRPMAINALFCLDPFTERNGATLVLPATHRQEAFPSESFVAAHAHQVTAPRGSYILLDCMCFHTGSTNLTDRPRRAVNHVYTSPVIRQQIDLPALLGPSFEADEDTRLLLGYRVRTPRTIAEFLESRRR